MPDKRNTDNRKRVRHDRRAANPAAVTAQAIVDDIRRHLDPDILAILRAAVLSADRSQCDDALAAALATKVRRVDLADFYIPQLARELGQDWCEDNLGFAQVTIGASRLQAMLRNLGPDWSGDQVAKPDAPRIMLIVPQDAHHTLGAMVLAGQLRRHGQSVRLMLGASNREIADRLYHTSYDGVFISASCGESLEKIRNIVDVVRAATDQTTPTVVGGSLLEVVAPAEAMAATGADLATSRADEALEYCDLRMNSHGHPPLTNGA